MTRNGVLMDLGRRCLKELNLPSVSYAYLGGSVGRGDADEFSDVDITICVEESASFETQNLMYEDGIRPGGLHFPYHSGMRLWRTHWTIDICLNRRHYMILLGNSKRFNTKHANTFLQLMDRRRRSLNGLMLLSKGSIGAVNSIEQNTLYSATVAGGAAWTDAAFMAMFFDTGSCSTGMLIPWMKINFNFQIIMDLCKWLNVSEGDVPLIVRAVERFRDFLRKRYPDRAGDVVLSPIQDALNAKKAQRLVKTAQLASLAWQFSGEAFWLYLETSNGLPLDEYIEQLPKQLAVDLERVGFVRLDSSSIRKLCRVADELMLRIQQPS